MLRIMTAYLKYFWKPQHYIWKTAGTSGGQKSDELKLLVPQGSPLEKIILGLFLKQTWRELQTGEIKNGEEKAKETVQKEQYKIFRKLSGERPAARRIDYR